MPEKTGPREKRKKRFELLLDSAWMTRGESKEEGGGGMARTVTAERPAKRADEGRRGPCDPATGVETIPARIESGEAGPRLTSARLSSCHRAPTSYMGIKDMQLPGVGHDQQIAAQFHIVGYSVVVDVMANEIRQGLERVGVALLHKLRGIVRKAVEGSAIGGSPS